MQHLIQGYDEIEHKFGHDTRLREMESECSSDPRYKALDRYIISPING
jgi:hypothetical protein